MMLCIVVPGGSDLIELRAIHPSRALHSLSASSATARTGCRSHGSRQVVSWAILFRILPENAAQCCSCGYALANKGHDTRATPHATRN